ncbi:flagellar protein FlaG [Sporosarcina sp. ACRSM]|uniref:flagellar protein FlaG n=1 Tax=Sporosarcina sp. ACRSM TaxID=2918216 RepID=UPI001EF4E3A2|nr:flagellar protein FlaG [Sporosarcina sp. ACRSM]MCG7334321.1 flagellar protein FlaG [Sporosarcina sp. ACRSM]
MVSRMDGGGSIQQKSIAMDNVTSNTDITVMEGQALANKARQTKSEQQLPLEKAQQLTESMNTFLESANTQLRFKLHDKLNEYYVTIIDMKTDEVVREIPSKKLMDIHAAMREFLGLLVDRKI